MRTYQPYAQNLPTPNVELALADTEQRQRVNTNTLQRPLHFVIMAVAFDPLEDLSSSPDTDGIPIPELSTPPLTHSGRTSPTSLEAELPDKPEVTIQKKKKKKKSKKSTKPKVISPIEKPKDTNDSEERPPILRISRNKHWKYISSYHVRFHISDVSLRCSSLY